MRFVAQRLNCITDAESRIMPAAGGGFEQACNAQAGVDVDTHLIVARHLTQQPNDKREVAPAVENLQALPEELGEVDVLLADTGFFLSSFQTWREQVLPRDAPPVVVADLGHGVMDDAMVEAAAYCLEVVE